VAEAAPAPAPRAAFDRLLKAYEGMDPENAAAALAEIYKKERQVVVEVLLGMKPRQAAAVLDALAATAPSIAAELSLEVWRRDR
jgi:flagellar motility protein MotE (MotC chaperone)